MRSDFLNRLEQLGRFGLNHISRSGVPVSLFYWPSFPVPGLAVVFITGAAAL